MSGCLEANTVGYSVSKEKSSVSNRREEWLIVLFTHLGKPHCKRGPWQHSAKATICLLKTSETRLWESLSEVEVPRWTDSVAGWVLLVEMLECREVLALLLMKQTEPMKKPRAGMGLTFLRSETATGVFFPSDSDCRKDILYPQWVVKPTTDLPGVVKVLKENSDSEIQKNERHLAVKSVGLQPRKLASRVLFLVASFDSVVLTEQCSALEGEKHGICIWYKEAVWSSWIGLDRTALVARRGRKGEKAYRFLWGYPTMLGRKNGDKLNYNTHWGWASRSELWMKHQWCKELWGCKVTSCCSGSSKVSMFHGGCHSKPCNYRSASNTCGGKRGSSQCSLWMSRSDADSHNRMKMVTTQCLKKGEWGKCEEMSNEKLF